MANFNQHFVTFLKFLLFLIIMGTAVWIVYNNKDFQKSNRTLITKTRFYLRDYTKAAKEISKKTQDKITDWKKNYKFTMPTLPKFFAADKKDQAPNFNDMLYDPQVLKQELPASMMRHQPDEITICSFDANFLINSPLTDPEAVHLANILRFCDLTNIAGLTNENVLKRIVRLLKILRYDAIYQISPAIGEKNKTFYAFLFRNGRINLLKTAKLFPIGTGTEFAVSPFYGHFKAGDFDFTAVIFQTPPSGSVLTTLAPLEDVYETIKAKSSEVQDVIIFGAFAFQSAGVNWGNSTLLPTVAELRKTAPEPGKLQPDLLGNLWFRKKDLNEFNGNSGIIDIKEESFSSMSKTSGTKPLWAQFKLMPDDD